MCTYVFYKIGGGGVGVGTNKWMCTTKLQKTLCLYFYVCTEYENCSAPAEFHCEECGNSYCGECLKWRHNGKRKNHQRITILGPKSQQSLILF